MALLSFLIFSLGAFRASCMITSVTPNVPTLPMLPASAATNFAKMFAQMMSAASSGQTGSASTSGTGLPANGLTGITATTNNAVKAEKMGNMPPALPPTQSSTAIQTLFDTPLGVQGTFLSRILPPEQMTGVNKMAQMVLCRNTKYQNRREFFMFGRCKVGDPNACAVMEMKMAAHNGAAALSLYYSGIRHYTCIGSGAAGTGMCCLKSNFALQNLDQP